MREVLVSIAIFVTACSSGIDMEQKWANSISHKYSSSIRHIVLTTLPEESDYTLDIELKPQNTSDFKGIMHDINKFLHKHPARKSVLVIDTSKLDNSVVASTFINAQAFRQSLKWIHYNYGAQDIEPGAGVKDVDPTLSLINKRNFPNLYHFSVVLSGDTKTNARNSQILKKAVGADISNKIDVDVIVTNE